MHNLLSNIAHKIGTGLIAISVVVSGWFGVAPTPIAPATIVDSSTLGAYSVTGGGTYHLKTSAGIADTTIQLSSFTEPVSGTPYTMSYLNTVIGYGTIDPQTDRTEFVSFTGVTQNSNGSAILTGVTRGLSRSPGGSSCIASTTLAVRHPGQSIFVFTSDSPCHFAEYAVKRNDETITGDWHVPTPSAGTSIANKDFVTSLVNGGTVSIDNLTVAAVAGETIQTGQIVYLNKYTGQWLKASALLASTSRDIMIGIAQGTATVGVNISGGVLLRGLDSKTIGGTAGTVVYLSDTTGATSTNVGTFERPLGIIKSTTQMYFDPAAFTPSLTVATGKIDGDYLPSKVFGDGRDGSVTVAANSTTTLTRDMYYNNLTVNGSIMTGNWRIFVADTLSGTGNLTATGTPGSTAVGLTLQGFGGATTTGYFVGCAGSNGAFFKPATNQAGGSSSSTPDRYGTFTSGRSGTGGLGGALGGGGAGGTGAAAGINNGTTTPYDLGTLASIFSATDISTTTSQMVRLSVGSGGTGGGSGGSKSNNAPGGGGGGACGGVAFVSAHTLAGSFAVDVSGGRGGDGGGVSDDGGGGGGGGGGKGGFGILLYQKKTWSGTCNASGGVGGSGGIGGAGNSAPGASGASGSDGYCLTIDVANLIR